MHVLGAALLFSIYPSLSGQDPGARTLYSVARPSPGVPSAAISRGAAVDRTSLTCGRVTHGAAATLATSKVPGPDCRSCFGRRYRTSLG